MSASSESSESYLKRASSCPDEQELRLAMSPKEEKNVRVQEKVKSTNNEEKVSVSDGFCQTDDFQVFPYEHLFPQVLPQLLGVSFNCCKTFNKCINLFLTIRTTKAPSWKTRRIHTICLMRILWIQLKKNMKNPQRFQCYTTSCCTRGTEDPFSDSEIEDFSGKQSLQEFWRSKTLHWYMELAKVATINLLIL